MFGCNHEWVTHEKTVAPPIPTQSYNGSEEMFERLHRGFVSVLRVCIHCGQQEKYELLGQPEAKP